MTGETSLKEMLTKLLDVRTSKIVRGKVIDDDPLEIQAENDPRLIITENNCFVPKWLTNHKVEIKIPGVGTENCTLTDVLGTVVEIIRPDGKRRKPGKGRCWAALRPVRRYLLFIYRRLFLNRSK